jgi:hypothetical protein
MTPPDDRSSDGFFPEENYEALRRRNHEYAVIHQVEGDQAEANIPYKPIAEPAWDRHRPNMPPKSARFEKLTRWGDRSKTVHQVVAWGLVAAGAVTLAGPALLTHLPH